MMSNETLENYFGKDEITEGEQIVTETVEEQMLKDKDISTVTESDLEDGFIETKEREEFVEAEVRRSKDFFIEARTNAPKGKIRAKDNFNL